MFKISPYATMTFGGICVAVHLVAIGAITLTNMVPAESIPVISAWAHAIDTLNIALLSGMAGMSGLGTGPLAPRATVEEARKVLVEAQIASATQAATAKP